MPGIVQMVDTFAKPKMCLLVDVIQWFLDQKITYEPQSIYEDVQVYNFMSFFTSVIYGCSRDYLTGDNLKVVFGLSFQL